MCSFTLGYLLLWTNVGASSPLLICPMRTLLRLRNLMPALLPPSASRKVPKCTLSAPSVVMLTQHPFASSY